MGIFSNFTTWLSGIGSSIKNGISGLASSAESHFLGSVLMPIVNAIVSVFGSVLNFIASMFINFTDSILYATTALGPFSGPIAILSLLAVAAVFYLIFRSLEVLL